ncbi:hypothetical protein T07_7002 [Trichinella nelsoni]|uniref:Uncharacterized protein n=1 Tax=Trichinella nelsoni TaxID=6336 RepID=A0A0V0SFN6_9BILA|nr:hypothetical protein T07_7002 [Trichinella nelsoni]
MLPAKREPGKKGNRAGGSPAEDTLAQRNPPVEDGPSSSSDDCANNSVGVTNGPARKSGL